MDVGNRNDWRPARRRRRADPRRDRGRRPLLLAGASPAKSPSAMATTTARARSVSFPRSPSRSAAAARARGCRRMASSIPACSRRPAPTSHADARGRGHEELRRHIRAVAAARGPLQRVARTAAAGSGGRARSRCTTLADEAKQLSHVGADGAPAMVDVSEKSADPARRARRRACASRAPPSTRSRRRLQHRQGPRDPHRDRRRHDGSEAHA